jgi:hypothetical protein
MSCHRLRHLLEAAGSAVLTGDPILWADPSPANPRQRGNGGAVPDLYRSRGLTSRRTRAEHGHPPAVVARLS